MLRPIENPVDRIWEALEAGRLEEALDLAERLRPAPGEFEAQLAVAVTYLEVGRPSESYQLLHEMANQSPDGDIEYARRVHLAEASFTLGKPEEALDLFHTLEPEDPLERAQLSWWKGLCYDHTGRTSQANSCFAEAQRLDPDGAPRPASISPDEVEEIVAKVAASLPEPVQKAFEEVPVVIQDLPSLDLIQNSKGEVRPDTLGLYVGVNLLERSHLDASGLPPTIYIYRRNLERMVETPEELEHEIRTTLLHELGHHLGYEEDDLDRLGLA